MQVYCFVLARKNSKRIKNKNMIIFNRKPLIYWTLKSAFKSKVFKKIILSSDWKYLIEYSRSKFKNLTVNKRNIKISKSNTKSETVLNYLLNKYKIKDGDSVLLQPTSPLRKSSYIKQMVKIAVKKNLKTLHSVSTLKNKTFINRKNSFFNLPSNIKSNLYLNGSIYVFDNKHFKRKNSLKEKPGNFFFHKKSHSLDLDELSDIKKFGLKYKFNKNKSLEVLLK